MTDDTPSPLTNVITDERIKRHLDAWRGSGEETLNALLNAEADRLCNAQHYERTEARRDSRAGHYERKLQTKAGIARRSGWEARDNLDGESASQRVDNRGDDCRAQEFC
jgi:Transposase, Mutator family